MAAHRVAHLSAPAARATLTRQRHAPLLPRLPEARSPVCSARLDYVTSRATRFSFAPITDATVFNGVASSLASSRPALIVSRRWRVSASSRSDGASEGGQGKNDRSGDGSEKKEGNGNGGAAGDAEMQQLLADMMQLQSDKARVVTLCALTLCSACAHRVVRVESFVEERTQLLTGIAESASAEYARIAEEAKRGMEEASSKVLQQVDAEADEFEQQLAAARADMERSEREFDEFEKSVEERRNSLLFFKQLYRRPSESSPPAAAAGSRGSEPASRGTRGFDSSDDSSSSSPSLQPRTQTPPSASSSRSVQSLPSSNAALSRKEQALKAVPELFSANQRAAASPFRRKVYAALVAISGLSLVQAVTHEPKEWLQVAASGLVFSALLVQALYERSLAGNGKVDERDTGRNK
ncbi:unnamed protein product [Closterium sp. NIES-64]|nr:unnamed protein product [Closterium sp. NIES-64]